MELLYIWVREYRGNIHEQGFNFSDKYLIEYNPIKKVLSLNNNSLFIKGFFNTEKDEEVLTPNINNITAIIGENGTGKSSVLDLIKSILSFKYDKKNNKVFEIKDEVILILKHSNELFIYHHENIEIRKVNSKGVNLNLYCYSNESLPNLNDNRVIYFSNIFDNKKYSNDSNNIIDISTNFLLINDLENKSSHYKSEVVTHRIYEILRQVKFLSSDKTELINRLPFSLPTKLNVNFLSVDIDDSELDFSDEIYTFFDAFKRELNNRKRSLTEEMYDNIIYNMVLHFFIELQYLELSQSYVIEELKRLKITNGQNRYNDIFKWLFTILNNREYKNKDYLRDIVNGLQKMFNIIESFILDERLSPDENGNLQINIVKGDKKLEEIIDIYQSIVFSNDFLELDWMDLSSGEKAFFNFYSRFYEAVRRIEKTSTKNILILIDEGEAYFHPQWQKKFLDEFINLITILFRSSNKQYNIQIIMTSNSPFIVSDLPKSNIIFLKRNRQSSSTLVVDGLEEHHQTFASNIHTLLSNSFFMQDGVIGEFAKRKINEVIDTLLDEEDFRDNLEKNKSLKKTINIIGEPLIRTKLINMLQEKVGLDIINLEEKMSDIQHQINKIVETNNLKRGN